MKLVLYQFLEFFLPPIKIWGVKVYSDLIQFKAFKKNHPFFKEEKRINNLISDLILKYNSDSFIDIGSNIGIHLCFNW